MDSTQPLLEQSIAHTKYSTMDGDYGDPMLRDKKKLPLSSNVEVTTWFLFNLLIILPLWLFLLVPLTLLYRLVYLLHKHVAILWRSITGKKPKQQELESASIINTPLGLSTEAALQKKERSYDIVIFGATGFTGRLAAIYMAKRYGTSIRWAIAGRRADALDALRWELAAIHPELASLPVIIADSSDLSSLATMVTSTKVILSTAGPFAKYGSGLVRCCAELGTHYCDTTGESDWVREMIDKHDDQARLSSARIVHFCGHDCVPWDLAVLECAKHLKSRGESLSEVNIFDELSGSLSGGTIATIFNSLENRVKLETKLSFDPLLKSLTGEKSPNKLVAENTSYLRYSSQYKQAWVGPFVMAAVMSNCVRRSNAVNNYGPKVVYRESIVYASFMAGFVQFLGLLVFGTALFFPPLRYLLAATTLPKPGQGPSEQEMNAGFLQITVVAKGSNGGTARAMFYFPTDPGYRDTARMLVESGLVLALDIDKVTAPGGVWTPATCQGELLRERLVATGSTFTIE